MFNFETKETHSSYDINFTNFQISNENINKKNIQFCPSSIINEIKDEKKKTTTFTQIWTVAINVK